MENPSHHIRRFFIHQPVVLFLRVLLKAIGDIIRDGFAGLAPHLILCLLFPAAIPDIPFGHDVDERRELPRTLVGTVHAVGDGDKPNPMLPEQNLCV